MEPKDEQRLAALEQKVATLETESAALQIALVALIGTHSDPTRFHLSMTRLLESAPTQPGQGPLQFLSPQQRDAVRDLVESWGTIPAQKPR
jgi:hypothetical protein